MPEEPLTHYQSTKRRRRKRAWPLFVWLAAAVIAGLLLFDSKGQLLIDGVVEVATESVGSHESGLIVSVPVVIGQTVRSGDVVAQLDTSLIDQEIEVTKESIRRRRGDTQRLYANTINRLESDRRSMVMRLAEDRARLEVLRQEVVRLEELVDQRLVTADILISTHARIASLDSAVALTPSLMKEIDSAIEENRGQIEELLSEENLNADYTANLSFLAERRDARSLRAQHDGVISAIPHPPGEVVRVGIPVIHILIDRPPKILGFLHERDQRGGKRVLTRAVAARNDERVEGRVVQLLPHTRRHRFKHVP